jgi:asparagine synthase (glutamine-hydrolysing)
MLCAVADARGLEAASTLFARVVACAGEPTVRMAGPSWVLGGWGPNAMLGRDSAILVEGSASLSAVPADAFEGAAQVEGDFALVSASGDGLVLASGRAGGYRPIYVGRPHEGGVVACTSLETSRALLRPPLDPDVLAAYATAATMFATPSRHLDRTLYAGILRMPMHEAWRVRSDGSIQRRETLRPLRGAEYPDDPEPLSRCLTDALRSAVRRAMSGHRRVGVMLSGGVDSSAIFAFALDLARRGEVTADVQALTWHYPTFAGDDRPHVQALATHLGVQPLRVTPEDAGPEVTATFVSDAAPLFHPVSPLVVSSSRVFRREGITLLLTGAGGDEVLDGEPTLFSEVATSGHLARAMLMALRLRGPHLGGPAWRVGTYVVRPLLRSATPVAVRRRRHRGAMLATYPWAGPRLRRYLDRLAATPPEPELGLASSPEARFEAMAASPVVFQTCLFRSQEDALTGCTRRDPYLDEHLMATVARIPPLALMRGHFLRGLLRDSMRDLVPDSVRLRRTKAVMEPALAQMVRAAGGFRVLDGLADVRMLADLGIAEPEQFRRSMEALERDPENGPWVTVWPALAAEAFARERMAA